MIGLLTFILGLVVLYLLSRIFIQSLYELLFRFTRSHNKAGYLLSLIFLPGTFIHEISHFLTALFLLVPVGKLELVPEVTERGIRMGSVQIGKTDLLRGSIIGIAPFIVGTSLIFGTLIYGMNSKLINEPIFIVISIYLIFQITHTMFSSKSDLRSVIELAVILLIVILLMLIFDITEPFTFLAEKIESSRVLLERLSLYVFIPIGVELLLVVLFKKLK